MKTFKFTLLAILALFVSSVSAQQQKQYGKTPETDVACRVNMQNYRAEYDKQNYDAALVEWREAFNNNCAPDASQNLYILGGTMFRYLIDKTTDSVLKEGRIDTLLSFYDLRIAHFTVDEVDLLYRKALDIETYRPNNYKQIYDAYLAAVKRDSEKVDLFAAGRVMLTGRTMYESGDMSMSDFMSTYTSMVEIADLQIKANPEDTIRPAIKAGIESAFLTTDAANCENLNQILGERFNANKNDPEVVKMVVSLLTTKECTTSTLYYESVEAYNKLNPSPAASYGLARMYYSKGEKERALQFFKEAVDTETRLDEKSKYYQEFASIFLKEGNTNQAISYLRQSIAANSRNAKAYLLLGMAYGNVPGCGSDEVSKRAVFWVAVDQLVKAKQLDSSLTPEANKSINAFSQHFPVITDLFFLSLEEGKDYKVQCGPINEVTKIRSNPNRQ